jgi:NADPH:quinone reductase-like Zn-dependent oxidoreductase
VVAISGLTALQGLRDHGKVRAGQRVLIIGASGGVGTYAAQLAKAFGAEVTGVCSTTKVDMVRSLGADHVIDYSHHDFAEGEQRHHVILDTGGNSSLLLLPPFVGQKLGTFVSRENHEDMIVLKDLIESGKLTPVIDRTYPLSETPEAIRYLEQGHARGKVVIIV